MAYIFTTNTTPTTGSIAVFNLLSNLVTAGWVVESWSDGTTFHSTPPGAGSTGFTSGNSGANGFGNSNAWFRIQAPGAITTNTREFLVQRSSVSTQYRIKYSLNAKFTGGSPSASQTPSATDEQIIAGGGTDAAPTFSTLLPADGGYRCNMGAESADGFQWYMVTFTTGGSAPTACWMFDFLNNTNSSDTDPYVLYFNQSAASNNVLGSATQNLTGNFFDSNQGQTSMHCYMPIGSTNNWVSIGPMAPAYVHNGALTLGTSKAPQNTWDSKDSLIPCVYFRPANPAQPVGFKGSSHTMLFIDLVTRTTGDTITVTTSNDHIIFGIVAFPWDGSTPTV